MYTATFIREQLRNNDRWLYRAVVAIYRRQTADEQATRHTRHNNGIGFNGVDAPYLSWCAQQIQAWQRGESRYATPLNERHTERVRRKMVKYAGQLATIANERQPVGAA